MDDVRRRWRTMRRRALPPTFDEDIAADFDIFLALNEGSGSLADDSIDGVDGTYNGATWATHTCLGDAAPTFTPGTPTYVQLDHTALEGVFDPTQGTFLLAMRGAWGGIYYGVSIGVDTNNRFFTQGLANALRCRFVTGGTTLTTASITVADDYDDMWLITAVTYSKADGYIRLRTPLGNAEVLGFDTPTWTASDLVAAYSALGVQTASNYFAGSLARFGYKASALSNDEVDALFTKFIAEQNAAEAGSAVDFL